MKKNLLFFFFALISNNVWVNAQDLSSMIPSTAYYIAVFNTPNYANKFPANKQPQKIGAATEKDIILTNLITNAKNIGINNQTKAYAYFPAPKDSLGNWVYMLPLQDAKLFATFTNDIIENSKAKSTNFIANRDMAISWNAKVAIVSKGISSYFYSYNDYDNPEIIALDEEQAEALTKQNINKILKKKQTPIEKSTKAKPNKKGKKDETIKEEAKYDVETRDEDENYYLEQEIRDSIYNYFADKKEQIHAKRYLESIEQTHKVLLNQTNMGNSIAAQKDFQKLQNEKFDIAVWVNTMGVVNLFNDSFNKQNIGNSKAFQEWFEGNQAYYMLHFEENGIKINAETFLNNKWANILEGSYKKSIDKKLLKYVKGDNLLAAFTLAINPERVGEATKAYYYGLIEAMFPPEPVAGEGVGMGMRMATSSYITSIMDLSYFLIDEQAIYNLFKGDVFIAITDLKKEAYTYKSYDYSENFESTEVEKKKDILVPEFLAIATIGDIKNIQIILNAIRKMGGLEKQAENLYKIKIPNYENAYIAIQKDLLFITNDEELLGKRLAKGYEKNRMLSKEMQQKLTSNPMAFYWNIEKTLSLALDKATEDLLPSSQKEKLKPFQKYWKSIDATWKMVNKNHYQGEGKLISKENYFEHLEELIRGL